MAFILADRVKETTTSTGTGSLTLAGAVANYRTFASQCVTNTDSFYYCIEDTTNSAWEIGIGRLTASTTLQRTQVSASSNSDALVNFSSGTKVVFITLPGQEAAGFGMSLFGTGVDGDLTVSAGTTTLGTRDRFYRNLTVNGTGSIQPANFRVFVSEVLDLSAAPAAAIAGLPTVGGNGGSSAAGAASSNTASGQFGVGTAGGAGGAGGVNAGTAGAAGTASSVSLGGQRSTGSAANGTGGTGVSAGAAGGSPAAGSAAGTIQSPKIDLLQGITLIAGGQGGAGGGGGGGNGAVSGGGGGGAGSGGAVVWIAARYLVTDGSTAATAIRSYGGAGGNGGSPGSGVTGGGGGGMGGGGGYVNLIVGDRIGAAVTGLIGVDSGVGGTGGNGFSTGGGGNGGGNHNSGTALYICLHDSIVTVLASVTGNGNGTAASGATGGAGRAATQGRLTC